MELPSGIAAAHRGASELWNDDRGDFVRENHDRSVLQTPRRTAYPVSWDNVVAVYLLGGVSVDSVFLSLIHISEPTRPY